MNHMGWASIMVTFTFSIGHWKSKQTNATISY